MVPDTEQQSSLKASVLKSVDQWSYLKRRLAEENKKGNVKDSELEEQLAKIDDKMVDLIKEAKELGWVCDS